MHHCKATCTPKEERKKKRSAWPVGLGDGMSQISLPLVAGGAIPAHGGCWKGSPPLQSMEAGRVWRMSGPSCLFCQDLVGLCISSHHSPSSTQQPQLAGTTQNPSRDIMFYKWHEPRHGMVGNIVQLSQQNSTMDAESKLWPWHPKTTQRRTETRPKKKKQPHQQDGGPSSLLPSSSPNKDSTFFTTDEIKSSSASKKSNPSLCDTMWTFPRFL